MSDELTKDTPSLGLGRVGAIVRLGRPQFLIGGFTSFALGAVMAQASGVAIRWPEYWAGQSVVTSVQLMTHYANDYFDFDADVANRAPTRWSGGSRVLPSGVVPRWVALAAAGALVVCALLAMFVVRFAFGAGGAVSAALMPAMLVLAWSYSAPPMRLHSRGLGELTAAVVVAAFVPWLGYAMQTGQLARPALLAVVPLFLLQFAMLLAIEIPDRSGDAAVGKDTLVVRLGVHGARVLHHAALLCAYVCLPVLTLLGLPASVAWAVLGTAPLGVVQVLLMARGGLSEPSRWEKLTFASVVLVFASTVAELVAFSRL